jgi:hypothetical protein
VPRVPDMELQDLVFALLGFSLAVVWLFLAILFFPFGMGILNLLYVTLNLQWLTDKRCLWRLWTWLLNKVHGFRTLVFIMNVTATFQSNHSTR